MADIFTSAGEAFAVDLMDATISQTADDYALHWGLGTTAAVKINVDLNESATEARVTALTITQPQTDQNQWVGTLTADGTKTITEVGLYDTAVGGTLIIHSDFTGIALNANDKIEFTLQLDHD